MKNKQTLFQRVYDDLHEQIVTERLACGTVLPSMRMMCDSYHVGIRTMKDVMARLREEGYIRTEERKPAVVIYDKGITDKDFAARSVLEYKTCILDVCETMFWIMPPIFSFSAAVCRDEEMKKWETVLKNMYRKEPAVRTKILLSFLNQFLEQSGNFLVRDLYASLELYAKMPLFQNYKELETHILTYNEFNSAKWVMEALVSRDGPETERRLGIMYEAVRYGIGWQLYRLSREFPDIQEKGSSVFTFDIRYERNAFYMQIVRDLIDKIGAGVYRVGAYLPPEAVLAENYGVCISTVRRALAMLNEIGFAKTYNAKGTKVIWQEDEAIEKCMKNKNLKMETLLYLSSLQLMAIIIKPAAVLAFPYIDETDKNSLKARSDHAEALLFEDIIRCVTNRQTLPPLKIILESIGELIISGYYYSMLCDGPSSDETLTVMAKEACGYLYAGDAVHFSGHLSKCYCHILNYVRDYMIKCGLSEAKKIVTPYTIE